MRRVKKFIQHILLYLLKALKMPLPFSHFTENDLLKINSKLHDTLDLKRIIPLYNLPNLFTKLVSISFNIDRNQAILTYKRLTDNAIAEIIIDNNYSVDTSGLDDDTKGLIQTVITDYLIEKKFLP